MLYVHYVGGPYGGITKAMHSPSQELDHKYSLRFVFKRNHDNDAHYIALHASLLDCDDEIVNMYRHYQITTGLKYKTQTDTLYDELTGFSIVMEAVLAFSLGGASVEESISVNLESKDLSRLVEIMLETIEYNLEHDDWSMLDCDICGTPFSSSAVPTVAMAILRIKSYVVHLNDNHFLPREEIADALDKMHDKGMINLVITHPNPDRG